MNYMPMKYRFEEGKQVSEDGTKLVKCSICNSSFAIPNGSEFIDVCENCKDAYEKKQAVQAEVDAKADTNAETADTIKKALGD